MNHYTACLCSACAPLAPAAECIDSLGPLIGEILRRFRKQPTGAQQQIEAETSTVDRRQSSVHHISAEF